jgi:hypothetical protein
MWGPVLNGIHLAVRSFPDRDAREIRRSVASYPAIERDQFPISSMPRALGHEQTKIPVLLL